MNLSDISVLTGTPLVRASVNTANVTSAAFDLSQYLAGTLKASQHVGAVTGTAPTLDGKFQDSADGVTFADVAGLTFAQVTASSSDQSLQLDPRAVRRYVRYVGTIAGSASPSFTMHVGVIGVKRNI